MSKGSRQRPDDGSFRKNWDSIFGKKDQLDDKEVVEEPKEEEEKDKS